MHVSAILKNKGATIITTRPDESVSTVAHILHGNRIGAILVLNDAGGIAGILSERDIVRGLALHGASVMDKPVSSLMTAKVVSCTPTDTVATVMSRMTEGRFRHMPVVENGILVGVISIGDVVKFRLAEYTHEVESLRDYVSGRG
ncbi:CBS domain-containing protein [Niveispirillum cyanobacteriorum]|uniref:Inosine-5-monophosphate dehydrogenase n=1 Tax=Niveispirillum cyanobacteriorum TaxID=1612173 RepID=A0A2K9N787_9PROT|nr:CBS domain-containing protein [Niveispirillum cyanobacteriorum]AUN29001.1 inosine-5-monophosphate dehydrogenase [Niveispirillum cyanobacteriorum]GGE68429.1 inosine-5-monophosphate dehydrogenase [Niveispirillum cyanobacteriorum]